MEKYTLLGHTADVRLLAEASTFPGLFRAALQGMNHILTDGDADPSAEQTTVEYLLTLTAPDSTALLVDFLSDALTTCYAMHAIFDDVEFRSLSPNSVEAVLVGHHVQRFAEDIKAVTYHEANVIESPDGIWTTIIIFDI